MNIIYKLTNTENGKSYIGQKMQCYLADIEGVPTIISSNRDTIYLGTSSNIEMKEALRRRVKFKAEILEEIPDKYRGGPYPFEREDYWIRKYNAVESEDFYNLSYPFYSKKSLSEKRHYMESIKNIYGETYKEYNSNTQAINRRYNTARRLGFEGLVEFCEYVCEERRKGVNDSDISRGFGKHRHFIQSIKTYVNFDKVCEDNKRINLSLINKAKYHRIMGASIVQVGKELQVEPEVVVKMLGTLEKLQKRGSFAVAKRLQMEPDELGYKIIRGFKENKKQKDIASELGIRPFEVLRYLYKFIREHIDLSEFDGIYKKE